MKNIHSLLIIFLAMACSPSRPPSPAAGEQGENGPTASSVKEDSHAGQLAEVAKGETNANPSGPGTWGTQRISCLKPPTTPAGDSCRVTMRKGPIVIAAGRLLTPEAVYDNGTMAFSADGMILCAGCGCRERYPLAHELDCGSNIIAPGTINAHDHLGWTGEFPAQWGETRYDNRHNWRLGSSGFPKLDTRQAHPGSAAWGELRQLISGTTAIAGAGGSPGFLRNLDADDEYALPAETKLFPDAINEAFPLGDAGGHYQSTSCRFRFAFTPDALGALPSSALFHVAEGIDAFSRNEFLCLTGGRPDAIKLLGPKTLLVHGIPLNADDGGVMAASGAPLVWSPRSNLSLYGQTAPVTMLRRQGVPVALGTDWLLSGSATVNREMSCALDFSRQYLNGDLKPRDVWLMATAHAAAAFGKADAIGSLRAGALADFYILASAPGTGSHGVGSSYPGDADPFQQVIAGKASDTLAVFKAGQFIYGTPDIADGLRSAGNLTEKCQAFPGGICGQERELCGTAQLEVPLDELLHQHRQSYPLATCEDAPSAEPACLPRRPGEYSGLSEPDDGDGDGTPDGADNCRLHFNPAGPDGGQPDADADGQGDLCDPCPLDVGNACDFLAGGIDRDDDGIPDHRDNCPLAGNGDQADRDGDGIGDSCDACREKASPDGTCPAVITDLKTRRVPLGARVRIKGQVLAAEGGPDGKAARRDLHLGQIGGSGEIDDFGGIFIFKAPGTWHSGEQVEIIGVYDEFHGQLQVRGLQALPPSPPATQPPPALPTALDWDDIAGLPADAQGPGNALEGKLVSIANARVTWQQRAALRAPSTSEPIPGIATDTAVDEESEVLALTDAADAIPESDGDQAPPPSLLVDLSFGGLSAKHFHADDVHEATGLLVWKFGRWFLVPRSLADFHRTHAAPPVISGFNRNAIFIEALTPGPVEPLPGALTLKLDRPAPVAWQAYLWSDPPGTAVVEPIVHFKPGAREASLKVKSEAFSGSPIFIHASGEAPGGAVAATLKVTMLPGDAPPEIKSVAVLDSRLGEGELLPLALSLDRPTPRYGQRFALALRFNPAGSDAGNAAGGMTGTVELQPGASEQLFQVQPPARSTGKPDADQRLTITLGAQSRGLDMTLSRQELRLLEIFFDAKGDDAGAEWVKIKNVSGQRLDLSRFVLAVSQTGGYDDFLLPLSGTLEGGGCAVIGPGTDAGGTIKSSFGAGLPNGGVSADGIALFIRAPGQDLITLKDQIPHDALTYGEENRRQLRDKQGAIRSPTVRSASAGRSLSYSGGIWRTQTPDPWGC